MAGKRRKFDAEFREGAVRIVAEIGLPAAKLLKRHGWSCQVPVRHAVERDEEAIEMWKDEVWPRLKGQRRTWAPISASRTRRARD